MAAAQLAAAAGDGDGDEVRAALVALDGAHLDLGRRLRVGPGRGLDRAQMVGEEGAAGLRTVEEFDDVKDVFEHGWPLTAG
ncbi:hypothetical protein GCM10009680_04390 [Streptomyces yatensis]|uniref:Uncharacterized protein n=1 Tax=Streptomyces yatensis TaxID=155177 RepID=A0ABN2GBJ6_9ACTN